MSSRGKQDTTDEQKAATSACAKCLPTNIAQFIILAIIVAILCIGIMILIWFPGIIFQVVVFVLGFVSFTLSLAIAILYKVKPIRCDRCRQCDNPGLDTN